MAPLLPVLACALVAAAARAAPEDCGLPKERGSCTQFAVRYYYDTEYGGCLRFWYGGCDGNGNRFETESGCERTCVTPGGDDLCRLPAVRGACKRSKTRWYSDQASGGCRQFTYSGCLGNDNRFETESACQQRCGRVTSDYSTGGSGGGTSGGAPATTAVPGPADCLLPDRVAGDCRKYVIRYSYVAARQQCAPFYYGGCGGNANRFDTAEACRAACSKPPTTRPPYYLPPRERAPPAGGGYPRHGYGGPDRPEGRVRPTEPSRRPTEPEWRAPDTTEPTAAMDICSLPALPGKCRAYFPRYYFNTRSQRCERFVYGGCQGNENNFETLADCEKRCGRPSQPSYGREWDRAAPTQPSRRPEQPETEAPYVPYRHQTEVPYVPYRPQTEAPYIPYQPETEALYVPYRPETEAPYVPYRPETEAPTEPESATVDATEPTDICSLPAQAGECRAYIRMYYFNARSQQCETFVYGGCGGNQNSFPSLPECEYRCGGTAHPEVQPTEAPPPETEPPQTEVPDAYIALPTAAEPDVCGLPPTAGPCDQRLQRYYFNAPLGSCFTFTYSGCGGNGNRFESAAECRARCQPGEPEVTYAPFPTYTIGGGDGAGVETTTSGEYPTYDYLTSDYPGTLEYYYDNYEYE